jgi:hypothetical protein
MVREIMREGVPRPSPRSEPEPSPGADAETLEKNTETAEVADESPAPREVAALDDVPPENDAVQQEKGEEEDAPAPHSHGGALPR